MFYEGATRGLVRTAERYNENLEIIFRPSFYNTSSMRNVAGTEG